MERKGVRLPDYSVLMSVYSGEKPEYLRECIDSMLAQTFVTNDFVLVCDGPLTEELDRVVEEYEEKYDFFRPLRLPENRGVGTCANEGLAVCRNEYIVKMDSDDIALPERCELSMYIMAKHPRVDMLGAYLSEFDSDTGKEIAVKKTPTGDAAIRKYARRRNPFNNPTLVYKKSLVEKIGGYSTVRRCEDYDFVVRMLAAGAVGRNIPKVLVRYRVTGGNYNRRKNWANTRSFIAVRWRIYRSGFSSLWDFTVATGAQLVMFLLPSSLTGSFYKKLLRKG
ncbi:glycosyltransferase [Ruminococcus sp.]|uniref:glycosyltransferase n=1 Tax=Ruminococcus sp. TaxID=41978 RepID=UPI0025D6A667|nr:glycosyltransferase [Ruminococcus sp.]MBQ8966669.1 glycosyltransferase [Ruminococcus sp.]